MRATTNGKFEFGCNEKNSSQNSAQNNIYMQLGYCAGCRDVLDNANNCLECVGLEVTNVLTKHEYPHSHVQVKVMVMDPKA